MSLLFESILVEKGELKNLELHRQRMQKSTQKLFGIKKNWNALFEIVVPKNNQKYKCKIVYETEIKSITFEKYVSKKIDKLKFIADDNLVYDCKYVNRDDIEKYQKTLQKNEEVLFIKNGFLTDSSYCNLALWDGEKWLTPKKPLLKGTQRQFLLNQKVLMEKDILWNELLNYKKISFINAMNKIGENEIQIDKNMIF